MAADERAVLFGEVLFDCFPGGQSVLGGAPFNVAWHLQAFGQAPLFISRIGDDALGRQVREAMRGHGMDCSGLQTDPSHPTGRVNITLNDDGHSFDILPEQAYDYIDCDALPPIPENALFYHGSLAARNPVSAQALTFLRSHSRGRRLVDINLRAPWWQTQAALELIDGAWLAKLNDDELLQLVPDAADDDSRIQQLMEHAGLQLLLVTRGAEGAELLTASAERYQVRPESVTPVVDTVGAGDALTSVLILALLQDWPYQQALERAQAFASAIVGRRGAIVEDPGFYQPFIDAWELA
ncbi:MAG TPA: carbohydrate kinase [Gammaproteobacteria bacterium]|nr:carbohydrate kinase [Gammaproteobacteria bacterium]